MLHACSVEDLKPPPPPPLRSRHTAIVAWTHVNSVLAGRRDDLAGVCGTGDGVEIVLRVPVVAQDRGAHPRLGDGLLRGLVVGAESVVDLVDARSARAIRKEGSYRRNNPITQRSQLKEVDTQSCRLASYGRSIGIVLCL